MVMKGSMCQAASMAPVLRVRPNAVDRCTDRERLTVAITYGAAMRGDFFGTKVARISLFAQEFLVENLEMNGARDQ